MLSQLQEIYSKPSFLSVLLVILPLILLPAFFLHPASFLWVVVRHVVEFVKHCWSGGLMAGTILMEDSIIAAIVLFWLSAIGIAIFLVRSKVKTAAANTKRRRRYDSGKRKVRKSSAQSSTSTGSANFTEEEKSEDYRAASS